jgi:hypothetical protein
MEKIKIITGYPFRVETDTNNWIAENTHFNIIVITTIPYRDNEVAVTIHYEEN